MADFDNGLGRPVLRANLLPGKDTRSVGDAMLVRVVLAAWTVSAASGTTTLAAQEPFPRVAQGDTLTITPSDIARHLAALTADSAPPADSASAQFEDGARYVAEQFGELGLRPSLRVDDPPGPWFQNYPVPGGYNFAYDGSPLVIETFVRKDGMKVVAEEGYDVRKEVRLSMATAASLVSGSVGEGLNGRHLDFERVPHAVVIAGPHTPVTVAKVAVRGKVVFYIPPDGLDSVVEQQVVGVLARESKGVIVVTHEEPARFAARQQSARRPLPLIDEYMRSATAGPAWVVYIQADTVAHVLALAGLDVAELRQARTLVTLAPLLLTAWFWVSNGSGLSTGGRMATNVVGLLEGSDSLLKRQYIVVSAHLGSADSACATGDTANSVSRGASECAVAGHDLSGVAGLLAMARAFAEAGTRPRRSVLFMATSGADHGFAGAEFLASSTHAVANLTLDLIGGRSGGSVVVGGLEEIDFGLLPTWVTAAHTNMDLAIVPGSILDESCADSCAFVRRKVPSLYFHDLNANHAVGRAPPASTVNELNPAHTARVTRLAFALAQAIANAGRSVRWRDGMLDRLRQNDDGH